MFRVLTADEMHAKSTTLAPWVRLRRRRKRNYARPRTRAPTDGQRVGRVLRRKDGNGVGAGSMNFMDGITKSNVPRCSRRAPPCALVSTQE